MLDLMTVIMWSITYILIIIAGFKSSKLKKVSMPYVAGVLNFSWEICAVIESQGFWGHILWLLLDCVIVYWGISFLHTSKQKVLYIASIIITTVVLYFLFQLPSGMLITVFLIDLIMALCFIFEAKKLSKHFKTPIAVTKLLGDAFAGMACINTSDLIVIIAVLVFLCNLFYLSYCLEEKSNTLKKK